MNADQLLQKAKEIEVKYNFLLIENDYDNIEFIVDKAKDLLTSIEKREIEGCVNGETKLFYGDIFYKVKCGGINFISKEKLFCPSCQQKINEAEKILREVLE